jgi:N-acetylglucosaminyldiphosphoundecaprenol N-acetyl-beta-D-mannosaminyltransferase
MAHTEAPDAPQLRPRRVRILDLPVDRLTMDEAVAWTASAIRADRLHRVVVTNAHKAWLAHRDERLRAVLESAELVIPEYATVWAARRAGIPGVHQVGGLTLAARLLREAPVCGWSVYLLGARPEVVERLDCELRRALPGLNICGAHHGYLDEAGRSRVVEELKRVRPDLLFVAMGSPLQEAFMAGLQEGMARVAIGVGGSFDVLAGFKKDAPRLRGTGLEWLYRLAQDPLRLSKRYMVTNAWFVTRVLWWTWRRRRS